MDIGETAEETGTVASIGAVEAVEAIPEAEIGIARVAAGLREVGKVLGSTKSSRSVITHVRMIAATSVGIVRIASGWVRIILGTWMSLKIRSMTTTHIGRCITAQRS